ncbi:hypothetical protein ABPG74_017162 [Tetrahymena malaccensis]
MGANQSTRIYNVPIDEKKQGSSQIMRHPDFVKELGNTPFPNIKNIQDLILHGYSLDKNKEFLGTLNQKTNQYEYITYDTVMTQAKSIASALQNLSLLKEVKDYKNYELKLVGIYAKNRAEWIVSDIANALYGYTMVPLYDSLGPESISYVLGHSGITTCYCSTPSIQTLSKTKDLHELKNIIAYDEVPADLQDLMKSRGVTIYQYSELLVKGSENILPLPTLSPNTIFTFSYTSGTTGNPKGAMISHKNILSSVSGHMNSDVKFVSSDIHLSYLPLPHIFERFVNVSCWLVGAQVAFFSGEITKLKDDIAAAKPTILITVPRLLNRFYEAIKNNLNANQGFKKMLIDYALETKLQNLEKSGKNTHMLYDAIVFSKIRQVFGGRVRILVSGSAPISPKVMDFFRIALSCIVCEGYGQTEGTGLATVQTILDSKSGNVGGAVSGCEIKLQDVPDMEYLSTDKDENGNPMPRGEICVRGNSIFEGYYKDEEKTKEAIDEEGWLHSGDIGQILPNGGLKIIDRKKNIFKLSQGEYISPEKVENIYVRARGVQEVYVHGESLYNFCVGIIVPNPEVIVKIASELSINETDVAALCQNKQIIEWYLKSLNEFGKKEGLFTFEQPQKIYLEPVSFTVHGCLTTSFKLQRHIAKVHFKKVIDDLYSQQ